MVDLLSLASGYLKSAGFKVLTLEQHHIVADKLEFGQDHATWVVWVLPPGKDPRRHGSQILAEISSQLQNYPKVTAYLLSPSRAGFPREFLQSLKDLGVSSTIPVWFFDSPFKVDDAPQAASAIRDLRSADPAGKRVAQPYRTSASPAPATDGSDLFAHLLPRLTDPQVPTVRVIVGKAGIGKSFLFNALFAQLYNNFLDEKRRQKLTPRPIPLVPAYLRGLYALRTELLIDNFLRTDVASPVNRETFEWLLVNGFATWLLDGLDELYTGDSNFFDYLLDLITRPNSRAQITIWCRDSLLTTSDAFAEFRTTCGTDALELYHLNDWERPSKCTFAWVRMEGRHPRAAEREPQRIEQFLQTIDASPTLRELSSLPFYCQLLIDEFCRNGRLEFNNDVALLTYAVDSMIAREKEKGLLDERVFDQHGLEDWLEDIALAYVEEGRYASVSREEAIEYGQIVLREGVEQSIRDHTLTTLLQFPLFCSGTEQDKIAFAHDLIAELLAARAYMRRILRNVEGVGRRLAEFISDPQTSSIFRFMAMQLNADEERLLMDELARGRLRERGGASLLSLLMRARPERDLVRRVCKNLDAWELAGVRFDQRDLSQMSFKGADLSNTVFKDCDLRGVQFAGAYMKRTSFDGKNSLQDAEFGHPGRVESIMVGMRLLEEPAEIDAWIRKASGRTEPPGEPCPTVLQLSRMFSKFVTPLGAGKRDELPRRALLAGCRYAGAASPEECLAQAESRGYLIGPDYRDRFRRAEGDRYGEMVALVRDGSVSDSLGRVVAAICPRRGCLHQVRV